jgi:CheY-like chemotaxis protein
MPKIVLIIDDEEDMRIYLETVFRKAGYETAVAVNGDEALEKIQQTNPDLITLDILMPRKSGLKFYEALRRESGNSSLPVIVVSGVSGNEQFFDRDAAGTNTVFMEKPINPDQLLKKAEELLGG